MGWDNQPTGTAILGKTVLKAWCIEGVKNYGLYVVTEAAGFDGILGSGWLEYERAILNQHRKELWILRKGRYTRIKCDDTKPPHRAAVSSTIRMAIEESEPGAKPPRKNGEVVVARASWDDVEAVRRKAEAPTEDYVRSKLPPRLHGWEKAFIPARDPMGGELPDHTPEDTCVELQTEDRNEWPRDRVRPLSETELAGLREILDQLLKKGFIRPSSSPMSSAVRLVRREDKPGLRLTVDYRTLNDITRKDRYPVPLIAETLRQIRKAKKVTKIDVSAAFHRVRIRKGDEWKTAFTTRYGLFEWLVTPFGLTNSPASFQRALNRALHGILYNGACAYADDILIYGESDEELAQREKAVLTVLMKAGLPIDIDKSEFGVTTTRFLGMILHVGEGVEMDPQKASAIRGWKRPETVRELRGFIGLAGYLRPFLPRLAEHTKPLYQLITRMHAPKSRDKLTWDQAAGDAFARIKKLVSTQQGEGGLLRAWDFESPGRVETDASQWAVGGQLLQQREDGMRQPAAFYSHQLTSPECRYTTHDKELLAVIQCLNAWEVELVGCPEITVVTDHRALKSFAKKVKRSDRHLRWKERLADFPGIRWLYRPGKENMIPDALSRKLEDVPSATDRRMTDKTTAIIEPADLPEMEPGSLIAASGITSSMTLWSEAKQGDAELARWTKDVLNKCRQWTEPRPRGVEIADCAATNDELMFRGRIWVPQNERLRTKILEAHHDGLEVGHPGRDGMYASRSQKYFWPGLQEDVRRYIRNCDICGRNRTRRERMGLLLPLPIPETPWAHIAMDYAVQLPKSKSNGTRNILIVVDRLTKEVELIPTATVEASSLAQSFLKRIIARHGYPQSIISDRGAQFTSSFWREICRQTGITLRLSTAYHPQTDGQSERAVQEVKAYLRRAYLPELAYYKWFYAVCSLILRLDLLQTNC